MTLISILLAANLTVLNGSVKLLMRRKFLPYKMNGLFFPWDGFMYASLSIFFFPHFYIWSFPFWTLLSSFKCKIQKTASTEMNSSVFFISVFQTHPSQSCFMSSVDLHTQYSYQVTNIITNDPYHWLRNFILLIYLIFSLFEYLILWKVPIYQHIEYQFVGQKTINPLFSECN